MPEILSDGGLYFDPEDDLSISESVEEIILKRTLERE